MRERTIFLNNKAFYSIPFNECPVAKPTVAHTDIFNGKGSYKKLYVIYICAYV